MVFFEKSQPGPSITSTHNTQGVIEKLEIDFHNKCYICEAKEPTDINVEHFVAHEGNTTLKLDWNNLFLSCAHCNNIKSNSYQNLLNCTVSTDNVDTAIHYHCDPFPKEKAEFNIYIPSSKANETKELLEKTFNGDHTPQKTLESANLRTELIKEICIFQQLLLDYYGESTVEYKAYCLMKIKFHLSNQSAFTAFKRWIIRDNDGLYQEFEADIED